MADHLRALIDTIGYETEIERQYKDPQQQLARAEEAWSALYDEA